MRARLDEERRAEREGRVCYCGHLGTHHVDWEWNWYGAAVGECGHADCDCLKYRYDMSAAAEMRSRWQEENRLALAMGAEEKRPKGTRRRGRVDSAMRGALHELGGNPGDLR